MGWRAARHSFRYNDNVALRFVGWGRRRGPAGFAMKKLVLFIVLPVLLIAGSGAALFFSGIFSPGEEEVSADGSRKPKPAVPGVFFDVPDFIINLKGPTSKIVFLQLKLSLELKREEEIERCKANLPRLQDAVLTYFHRRDPDTLLDDPGFAKMRADLVQRLRNVAKPPLNITNVNISDLRIQ
jgi:flagellar FliL protein